MVRVMYVTKFLFIGMYKRREGVGMNIKVKLGGGMKLYRGEPEYRVPGRFNSDPGDFGRGIYHTTSKARAGVYGTVKTVALKLANPLILDVERAYDLGAGVFNTLGNNPRVSREQTIRNCERLTRWLLRKGYDGLVSVSKGRRFSGPRDHTELEIVSYKPYNSI